MGFGIVIASGEDNTLLSEDLMCCLTEVRVEQFLDRPTQFAMRFQEDLNDDGEPRIVDADELAPETIITVAVKMDEDFTCLVRGPITEVRSSFAHGGPGSWFEARGVDRRVEMSRNCHHRAWVGRASGAVQSIFSSYGFETEIQETTQEYSEDSGTLNQHGNDLDFINQQARRNNFSVWIRYTCRTNPQDLTGGTLEVEETANFSSSPPRPDGASSLPAPLPVSLVPSSDLRLVVNPPPGECQTVTSFELDANFERPTSSNGQAVDDRSARIEQIQAEDTQPAVIQGGQDLRALAPSDRAICPTTAGNQTELQNRSQAALTEAGWMLNATAQTTSHMLRGVLVPHDIVEVDNVGVRHSGSYQVSQATHTINGADHHMQLQLRRNALGNNGNGTSPF